MMKLPVFLLFSLMAAPLVGVAKSSPQTVQDVVIENMQYTPKDITVSRGETIQWINKDLVPHTVTSTSGSFDSKTIQPNGKWRFRARKTGNFPYKCNFHPTMAGSLTVQ